MTIRRATRAGEAGWECACAAERCAQPTPAPATAARSSQSSCYRSSVAIGTPSRNAIRVEAVAETRSPKQTTPVRFSGSAALSVTIAPSAGARRTRAKGLDRLRQRVLLAGEARDEPASADFSACFEAPELAQKITPRNGNRLPRKQRLEHHTVAAQQGARYRLDAVFTDIFPASAARRATHDHRPASATARRRRAEAPVNARSPANPSALTRPCAISSPRAAAASSPLAPVSARMSSKNDAPRASRYARMPRAPGESDVRARRLHPGERRPCSCLGNDCPRVRERRPLVPPKRCPDPREPRLRLAETTISLESEEGTVELPAPPAFRSSALGVFQRRRIGKPARFRRVLHRPYEAGANHSDACRRPCRENSAIGVDRIGPNDRPGVSRTGGAGRAHDARPARHSRSSMSGVNPTIRAGRISDSQAAAGAANPSSSDDDRGQRLRRPRAGRRA